MQFQAQRDFQLLALLILDVGLYDRLRDVPDKALAAVLGTENDVQVQIVDAVA